MLVIDSANCHSFSERRFDVDGGDIDRLANMIWVELAQVTIEGFRQCRQMLIITGNNHYHPHYITPYPFALNNPQA